MSEKYKSDKWGILWYITKILRSYFTTCRRKYSGQTKSVQSTMGSVDIVTSSTQQLSYLLIGCIYYGMI